MKDRMKEESGALVERLLTERFRRALFSLGGDTPIGDALAGGMLVGFSGGADSSALLSMLVSLRDGGAFPPGTRLLALHLHHGLRGEAADGDEAFCRDFCLSRGIEYRMVRGDVAALAARLHTGIEDAGRRFRYGTFSRVMKQEGLRCLLTAHQGDDQTETVLLHLLRGCGGEGLRGIPAVTALPGGGLLLRPLLSFSSSELREYCKLQGIAYRTDGSNKDTAFRRNALRERVIPLLEALNPALRESVGRMTALLTADAAYFREETEKALRLPEEQWDTLPDALLSRLLQRRCRDAMAVFGMGASLIGSSSMKASHVDESRVDASRVDESCVDESCVDASCVDASCVDKNLMETGIYEDPTLCGDPGGYLHENPLPMEALARLMALVRTGEPFRLSLPGGMTAWRTANGKQQRRMRLYFVPESRDGRRHSGKAPLPIPLRMGENRLPGFPARLILAPTEKRAAASPSGDGFPAGSEKNKGINEKVYKIFIKILFPFATIQGKGMQPEEGESLPLCCRAPGKGERFLLGGRERPVRELLREHGVPVPLRDCYPLLADEKGILWIPGFPPRDGTEIFSPGGGNFLSYDTGGTSGAGGIVGVDGGEGNGGDGTYLVASFVFPKTITENL